MADDVATIVRLRIEQVTEDPRNARQHPTRNLKAITTSLKRFGQQRPIIIDATGKILAGHGTYRALRAIKARSVLCLRSALTGPNALAYAITDNRTSDLAEWDAAELRRQLADLTIDDKAAAQATGFSPDELAALRVDGHAIDATQSDLTSTALIFMRFTMTIDEYERMTRWLDDAAVEQRAAMILAAIRDADETLRAS